MGYRAIRICLDAPGDLPYAASCDLIRASAYGEIADHVSDDHFRGGGSRDQEDAHYPYKKELDERGHPLWKLSNRAL